MTRVVVVEDHTLLRQSLVKTVSLEQDLEVVGEASRGDEAVRTILRERPDVALLDIAIPGGDGLEVAVRLKRTAPEIRILFLSMHDDQVSVSRAMALGADGYILKAASIEELLTAIRTVALGKSYLGAVVARRVMALAGGRGSTALTARELEILSLLANGARPAEVGETLFVSPKTVKNHLTSIYSKLGVETAAQAVGEAYRRGIVAPHPIIESA